MSSIFGNTGNSSGGIFGNSNAANSGGNTGNTGGSIFGNTAVNTGGSTNPGTPTPSIFGNPSGGGTGSIFGNTGTAAKPTTTGGSIFGAGAAGGSGGGSIFGGNNPSTSTPAASSGGIFGNTAAATSTPSTNTSTATTTAAPSLFGTSGASAFSLPKPADQTSNNNKPASSFFGQPPSTSAPAAGSAPPPTLGGGLFGPKPTDGAASTNNAAPTSTPAGTSAPAGGAAAPSAFGLFGAKPATTPTSTTATPAAGSSSTPAFSLNSSSSTAPATGLFGAKPAEKKDEKPAAGAAAPATGVTGSLFGPPKTDDKKDSPASTSLSGGVSLGSFGKTDSNKPGGPTPAGPLVAVPPPSMLRGKTIEDIVNKWSTELETHVKEFNKFAAEVSTWDRALIENGNNLAALYSHVLSAEREQTEVDQSLDHIEQQQKDLMVTLDSYEKLTDEIFGGSGGSLRALDTGPADTERDKNYMLATDLHTHLDDLSNSLTQMIESVNSLSLPSNNDTSIEDPMAQISQILSTHLESLQWIDGAVREVESKVTEVEKRVKESGHAPVGNAKSRGFGLR